MTERSLAIGSQDFNSPTANSSSILVLTPGDPDGIGPEITWKMLQSRFHSPSDSSPDSRKYSTQPEILCVGARAPFEKLGAPVVLWDPILKPKSPPPSDRPFVWLWPAPESAPEDRFLPGFQAGWAIEQATRLVLQNFAAAIVTGPISKERLQKGGYIYPGHTEFLAELCKLKDKPKSSTKNSNKSDPATDKTQNVTPEISSVVTPEDSPKVTPEVTMMLANQLLRVTLVTTHIGINEISSKLTRQKIRRAVLQTQEGLTTLWGIKKPKIAIAALNPHAGENGLFGREEIETIEPEIQSLRENFPTQMTLVGPLPADTLFAKNKDAHEEDRYDAVVCMYHDQGLIPVKLLDFHNTVNITLGLPVIRTSVDHGVGFDIVGKGIADPSSLHAAVQFAIQFTRK